MLADVLVFIWGKENNEFGDFGTFINVPSLVVVISGTSATTPARVSLEKFFGSFKVGLKSVLHKREYLH